jgi:mRNA interferase HigB
MKVHLIRRETIEDFSRQNAQSKTSFAEWLTKIKFADWEGPSDIQDTFPGTDLLGNSSNRVVLTLGIITG